MPRYMYVKHNIFHKKSQNMIFHVLSVVPVPTVLFILTVLVRTMLLISTVSVPTVLFISPVLVRIVLLISAVAVLTVLFVPTVPDPTVLFI